MAVHDRTRGQREVTRDIFDNTLLVEIITELRALRMHMELLTGHIFDNEEIQQ